MPNLTVRPGPGLLSTARPLNDTEPCFAMLSDAPFGSATPGFLIHDFWAGRESSISGVWAAPGPPGPP